jgi:triphosphatase
MDTEIEIKLVISDESEALICAIEASGNIYSSADKSLANIYFDTSDRQLRQMDIGLRVRSVDGNAVQTIKTAGREVGGLHQRPEYNFPIEGSRPDLSLFPSQIWPAQLQLEPLQKQLVPLFSTCFRRRTWCLRFDDGSEVEVALDIGQVEANHLQEPICEVEFELLKGDPDHLFGLARAISTAVPSRVGHLSKAARGYRLAAGLTEYPVCPLVPVQLNRQMSIEAAFELTIKHALDTIQHNEQSFITAPSFTAIEALYQSYVWLESVFKTYQSVIPLEASETLRSELDWLLTTLDWVPEATFRQHALADDGYPLRKLDDSKQLIQQLQHLSEQSPDEIEVRTLLQSTRYCQLVLSFTEWMFEQGWRRYMLGQQAILNESIDGLGRQQLREHWLLLYPLFSGEVFVGEDFVQRQGELQRALQQRFCFASLFVDGELSDSAQAWIDLEIGALEWRYLDYLQQLTEALPLNAPEQSLRWFKRKRNSLLHALEQSRHAALANRAFE